MVACRLPIALPGLSHSIAVATRNVALRAFVDGYQYEAKILFCACLDADTRKQARMCVGTALPVHSHHMSSAADAKDAQNGAYFWVSIRSKNTFLCLAGCRYKEASSNVRGGRTHVRSHHMSSAADAVGAPAKHKNKKKPVTIYSPT